jgi:hypothetical protein
MKTKPAFSKDDFPQPEQSRDYDIGAACRGGAGSGINSGYVAITKNGETYYKPYWYYSSSLMDASGMAFSNRSSQAANALRSLYIQVQNEYSGWTNVNSNVTSPWVTTSGETHSWRGEFTAKVELPNQEYDDKKDTKSNKQVNLQTSCPIEVEGVEVVFNYGEYFQNHIEMYDHMAEVAQETMHVAHITEGVGVVVTVAGAAHANVPVVLLGGGIATVGGFINFASAINISIAAWGKLQALTKYEQYHNAVLEQRRRTQ